MQVTKVVGARAGQGCCHSSGGLRTLEKFELGWEGGGEDMNSLWAEYAWETVAFLSESLRSHRQ